MSVIALLDTSFIFNSCSLILQDVKQRRKVNNLIVLQLIYVRIKTTAICVLMPEGHYNRFFTVIGSDSSYSCKISCSGPSPYGSGNSHLGKNCRIKLIMPAFSCGSYQLHIRTFQSSYYSKHC